MGRGRTSTESAGGRRWTRLSRMAIVAATVIPFVVGCGGESTTAPSTPPVITLSGVEDDGVYTQPITIQIEVDRGSYSATLDGEPFLSGSVVSELGRHELVVSARDGEDTASRTVAFRIEVPEGGVLIVRMIDLGDNSAGGGGDAILLTDSTEAFRQHVLVDAGPAGVDGSDPGHVARRLGSLGVSTLEALVLTHAHSDHFDGIPAVLGSVGVKRFVYNGQVRYYSGYTQVIQQAEARADSVLVPDALLPLVLNGAGGTEVTVIPPLTTYLDDPGATSSALNEGSLGTAVRRGDFSMFMTGDGEVEANRRWREEFSTLSGAVDVLKVGHHGANDAIFDSYTGGGSSWLQHTDPQIALISANGTTHPRHNALTKILDRTNTRTYCTNVHGDIELRVDAGGTVRVAVQKNADADCKPGSQATS